MLCQYKLFSSFKIDRAMNFLSRQVARDWGLSIFPRTKNTHLLNFIYSIIPAIFFAMT